MVSGLMTRLQQTLQSLDSLTEFMQMETEVDHRRVYLSNENFTANFSFNKNNKDRRCKKEVHRLQFART